jgi:hypothetical protein
MSNSDYILSARAHFEKDVGAGVRRGSDFQLDAQNTGEPMGLDGNAVAGARAVGVHPDEATGGAVVRGLDALARGRKQCVEIR